MSISNDLFMSILSMDAYNRGYNEGLKVSGGIGTATLLRNADDPEGVARAASFFAQAYTLQNGQKIISYRGTDDLARDPLTGWLTGGGAIWNSQATLAAQFFQSVVGNGNTSGLTLDNLYDANITLTGHSLGGGLAGLIASVYRQQGARIFDPMAFSLATTNTAHESASPLWPLYFLNNIGPTRPFDLSSIKSYVVQGEELSVIAGGMVAAPMSFLASPAALFNLGFPATLSAVQRHSQGLLIIRMFAEEAGVGTDWLKASQFVLPNLFNEEIAKAIGLAEGGVTGTDTAAGKMRSKIAYSAIDEGTRPYGDSAIRALYNDATDLGKVLGRQDASSTLKQLGEPLGKIIAQYAGFLADAMDVNNAKRVGVFTLDDEQKLFIGDLSQQRWTSGENTTSTIVGRHDLIRTLLDNPSVSSGDISSTMARLWGDPTGSRIDRVLILTEETAFNGTMPARPQGSAENGITFFASAGLNDTITGSARDEIIYGGKGVDTISGGAGNDLLSGGDQDDTLYGDQGADVLVGGTGVDTLRGGEGNDELRGGAQADWLVGDAGDDFIRAGDQSDTIFADTGNDQLYGEDGIDTLRFTADGQVLQTPNPWDATGVTLTVTTRQVQTPTGAASNVVLTGAQTGQDELVSVEIVELTAKDDNVTVAELPGENILIDFDPAGAPSRGRDTLDLSALGQGLKLKGSGSTVTIGPRDGGAATLTVKGADKISLGSGKDYVDIGLRLGEIHLGAGEDRLVHVGEGTVVYGGSGNDRFDFNKNILIADAEQFDKIYYNGNQLTGGVKWGNSELHWATGAMGIRYAINTAGELVIRDTAGRQMFVSNFDGDTDPTYRTAGIYVIQIEISAYRLLDIPSGASIFKTWEVLMGNAMVALTGKSYFGTVHTDPLVLDLDGDGIELSVRSDTGAAYDVDSDGFAEHVGWVRGGDGLLARDLNHDGKIEGMSELFGNESTSGFSVLAGYDDNHDGVIDGNDAVFSDLVVWRDANGDAITDPGELLTLADLDIVSISVQATETAPNTAVAGNLITETATFTRGDGSTGTIVDAQLHQDDFNTKWTGDSTISAEAAALPELKGYGTLTSLRVAATLDPTLIDVVEDTLPLLNTTDLAALRVAARPILTAWANAVPVPAGTPGTTPRPDFHVVSEETVNGITIDDYLVKFTDAQGTYWGVASGRAIKDADGNVINRPTQAQVLADPPPQGSWSLITGEDITFLERYLGDPIDLDDAVHPGQVSALNQVLDVAVHQLDKIVVRLASQGPLAPFFTGVAYDAVSDQFKPTTAHQLSPMLEAIFAAAPETAEGATDYIAGWQSVLRVMVADLNRGGVSLQGSYAYLFQNIVSAYENQPIPLTLPQAAAVFAIPQDLIRTGLGEVNGGSDADLFYLGAGDQIAKGGTGPDAYVVGRDFGHDIIQDIGGASGDEDTLRFAHLNKDDLTFVRDGKDLIITETGTDNQLRIVDEFAGQHVTPFGTIDPDLKIEVIVFSDGTIWDDIDIAWAAKTVPQPTSDTITGSLEIDVLDGGGGNDYVNGGGGSDIYLFGFGDGRDVIYDDGGANAFEDTADMLMFKDAVTMNDVRFARVGDSNDLAVELSDGSVAIIRNQLDREYTALGDFSWYQIEGFLAGDGSSLSWQTVNDTLLEQAISDGDDRIIGFYTDDVLDGGAGDDFLNGGGGHDTFIFGRGSDRDTIAATFHSILASDEGKVLFSPDIVASDLEWIHAGDDLVIHVVGTNDFLTIVGEFDFNPPVGRFEFADGTFLTYDQIRARDLVSTAGNDTLIGTDGNDVVAGGLGDDVLKGGNGNDQYIFNPGDGRDAIEDSAGNDELVLGAGIAPGDVHVFYLSSVPGVSAGGQLVLTFAGSDDRVMLASNDVFGNVVSSIETVTFADGTHWSASDLIGSATALPNTVGVNDGETVTVDYDIADGLTQLNWGYSFGEQHVLNLHGVAVDDVVLERIGDGNQFNYIDGNGFFLIGAASRAGGLMLYDALKLNSIDRIVFDDGTVWDQVAIRQHFVDQEQSAGDDLIVGWYGDDSFDGGTGNDAFFGGDGSDTYTYRRGDGIDRINDTGSGNDIDRIVLADIALADVKFIKGGNDADLIIEILGATPGQITVTDHFVSGLGGSNNRIEQVQLADGTILTASEIEALILAWEGTDGDDRIAGSAADNIFTGGLGDDYLMGNGGADTYVWSAGDGRDLIANNNGGDNKTDTLVLHGVLPSEVAVLGLPDEVDSIEFDIGGQATQAIVLAHQLQDFNSDHIGRVVFDDGTVWLAPDIVLARKGGYGTTVTIAGTAASETVTGTQGDDVIDAGASDDAIDTRGGSDLILYGVGSGNDTLNEAGSGYWRDVDTLRLVGLTASDVTFSRYHTELTITINSSGETFKVSRQFFLTDLFPVGGQSGIERVEFADGSVWNYEQIKDAAIYRGTAGDDFITGTDDAEVFAGFGGNDWLQGGRGSDTYVWSVGDGDDTIAELNYAGDVDSLVLHGVDADGLLLSWSGSALNVLITSSGETIHVNDQRLGDGSGVERITLDDGTVLTAAQILELAAIYGTSGDDFLSGTFDNDRIIGRTGDDVMFGGYGSDTYVYASGDGNDTIVDWSNFNSDHDTLELTDLLPGDVELSLDPSGQLTITILETGEQITVINQFYHDFVPTQGRPDDGIDVIKFAGGTVWDRAAISHAAGFILGTEGDDVLIGSSHSNVINALGGNDTVDGAGSDDFIDGGAGADIIRGGDGDDQIKGGEGADALYGDAGNDAFYVVAGEGGDTIDGGGGFDYLEFDGVAAPIFVDLGQGIITGDDIGTITVANVEVVSAGLGDDALTGGAADEVLLGSDGNDTLRGGAGADYLEGDAGNDTYIFNVGDGADEIEDWGLAEDADVLIFGAGIAPAEVSYAFQGDDLLLTIGTSGDSVLLIGQMAGPDSAVEEIHFADGTIVTSDDLLAEYIEAQTSTGDDNITGTGGNDIVHALDGNDSITGGGGDDTIDGGPGSDTAVFSGNYASYSVSWDGSTATVVGPDGTDTIMATGRLQFADRSVWLVDDGADADYSTIQAAVDAAASGDVIMVGAGSYSENVTIAGKSLTLDGAGRSGGSATTLHGQVTVTGTLDGGLSIKNLAIDATGQPYGVFVSAGSTAYAGSVTLDNTTISNAKLDGFAYIRAGNGSTPTLTDTIGAISILRSEFFGNATQTSGANGRGDILLFGFNGDLAITDVAIHDPGAGAQKAIQVRGLQDGADVGGVGPYDPAGDVSLADLTISGTYLQDLIAFYRIAGFASFMTFDVNLSASAPWGLLNFDEVGGTIDLSSGVTATNLSGGLIAVLQGLASGNNLIGTGGNDYLDGRDGADTLYGGTGSDIYRYGIGSGNDTIVESTEAAATDKVMLVGLNSADVTLRRSGSDLYVKVNSSGEELKVQGHFSSATAGIEQLVFADATTWDRSQIQAAAWFRGTTGNETMSGTSGNDTFFGDLGNDTFSSGAGSDTYVYRSGDGNDYINDESGSTTDIDTLRFTNLNASDLTFTRSGVHLVIKVNATGQTVTIDEQYYSQTANWGIEKIEFADGTSWNLGQITAAGWYRGTTSNDTISGSSWNDTFFGDLGNDTFSSGTGSDTYIYRSGDGNDYINDESGSTTDIDTLRFTNLNATDLTFSRSGVNLVITVNATGQTVTIDEQYYSQTANWGIEKIEFADGTSWSLGQVTAAGWYRGTTGNDSITGSAWDDSIDGGAGDDTLNGGTGADTLVGGLGNDTYVVDNTGDVVTENAGEGTDTVQSTVTYTLSANVENLTLTSAISGTGNDEANIIIGNGVANILTGLGGNDTLNGMAGSDTLIGGLGNDTYVVDVAGDVVTESADEGTDLVQSLVAYTLGANVENLTLTGTGAIDGTGNSVANIIIGNSGNNILAGLAGADTLDGGGGTDTATYAASAAGVAVSLATGLGSGGDAQGDTLTNIENLTGSNLDDTLEGNAGANALTGGSGIDTVSYANAAAGVTVNLATTSAQNTVGAGSDTLGGFENLAGSEFNDTLTGTGSANVLTGLGGNDTLNGGAGNDTLIGGAGNDTYVVDVVGDVITENAGEGTDLVQSLVTYTLGANVENLTLTGTSTVNGTGNDEANIIIGNSANNILAGLAGADTLDGGTGTDTATYAASAAAVAVSLTAGTTSGGDAQGDTLTNIENLTGSSFGDTLEGNSSANVLTGLGGNDTLNGMAGSDTLIGGLGDDTYVVDVTGDVVTESADEGTDLVQSLVAYTLGANVENLTLTGTGAINGTGNSVANIIIGNSGNNILAGLAGADTLDGGGGTDTATYAASAAGVAVSLATGLGSGGDAQGDTLINIENLTGSNLDDTLEGNAGANALTGGSGIDTVSYANAAAGVTVNLATTSAQNTVGAGSDTLSGFENLTGSEFNDTLTGTSSANVLTGLGGNDTLDGGAGNDTLIGGAGNDTYVVDVVGDVITENAGEGTDLVQSLVAYTLGANVENLTLTGTGTINGTGNDQANIIIGNSANNILAGLAGADTLDGGGGTDTATYAASAAGVAVSLATGLGSGGDAQGDTLINLENLTGSNLDDVLEGNAGANVLTGGSGIDTVSYANAAAGVTVNLATTSAQNTVGAGSDTLSGFENLTGSEFNDTLTGTSSANVLTGLGGNDTLNGGADADTLIGGANNDTLTGGAGNDSFLFRAGFGTDTITDFTAGAGSDDAIDFYDGIFADYAAVIAAASTSGSNTIITVDASTTITLTGVALASLHQDDFRFH